eukprot:9313009-Pyramimonas_sp.AAC.1
MSGTCAFLRRFGGPNGSPREDRQRRSSRWGPRGPGGGPLGLSIVLGAVWAVLDATWGVRWRAGGPNDSRHEDLQ